MLKCGQDYALLDPNYGSKDRIDDRGGHLLPTVVYIDINRLTHLHVLAVCCHIV